MSYDRRPLKSRSLGAVQSLAKALAERNIYPNTISLASMVFAAVGFAALWGVARGWQFYHFFLILAVVCIQGRLLCNLVDGLVAVEWDMKQKGGDLFNELPDRVSDTLFLVGAGYVAGNPELGWLCSALAIFTAYVRAFGSSLGQPQDFGGPCAKQQRMFLLTVGLILTMVFPMAGLSMNILNTVLWVIAAGTAITAWLRIRRLYERLP
jgi:phosphatidylglycerophosphate synthase